MLKRGSLLVAVFALCLICVGCGSRRSDKLTIAAASNTQFALEEVIQSFENKTGIECELIVGSSGKLTAQITQGAPYDVFLSADLKYPKTLFESKLTIKEPRIYAYGRLVLWTIKADIEPKIESLTNENIHQIAIPNPKTAPYGKASEEVLNKLKIYDRLKEKLVFGENISQTSQFVFSESVDVGFTSLSVVHSPELMVKGNWTTIPQHLYSPLAQGMVILQNGKREEAKKFEEFLFSESAIQIFSKFGYYQMPQ